MDIDIAEIRQEYEDARDVYARDPRWPTNIAPERWDRFPTLEEWAQREYQIVIRKGREVMNPNEMIGKKVLFKGSYLGTITEARFGHVVWSHSQHWTFKLDCGARLRDVRDSANWQVE